VRVVSRNARNGNSHARETRAERAKRMERSRLNKPESAAFDALPVGAVVRTEEREYQKLDHRVWAYTDNHGRAFSTACPPLRAQVVS
jgi:hypothetical protein